jgi:class 3 adenylate cyclase
MESLSNSIEKAQHSELELTKEYLVLAEQATINASFELAYDYSQKALIHAQNIEDDLLIAESYALLGRVSFELSMFRQSIEYIRKGGSIFEKKGLMQKAAQLCNKLGISYAANNEITKAIDYHLKGLGIAEEIGDLHETANSYSYLGNAYSLIVEYGSALDYYKTALSIIETIDDEPLKGKILCNIGICYSNFDQHDKGLEYILRSIAIFQNLDEKKPLTALLANLAHMYLKLKDYSLSLEYSHKSLALSEEMNHASLLVQNYSNLGIVYYEADIPLQDFEKSKFYLHKALTIAKEHDLKDKILYLHKDLSSLWEYAGDFKQSLMHYKMHIEMAQDLINADVKKQVQELETERTKLLQEKEFEHERIIAAERSAILENILPASIIQRLVNGEKRIVDRFKGVCVLFLDIAGFTEISEALEPEELLDLMDSIFTSFDEISNTYKLEKIKTIGDAYMAVCGAQLPVEHHALMTIYAAMSMMNVQREIKVKNVMIPLRFRIGIHCGNVVAGIIGENKYSYDLWGDAVNTASRMETNSEPGYIHTSQDFVDILTQQCAGKTEYIIPFVIDARDPMNIKGKGMMQTYYIKELTKKL